MLRQVDKNKKIFVAMSGGVDSSVAAALLQKQGWLVVGCHLKCFNVDGCGEQDAEDARRVAEQLKIPFYVFDLEKEYKERVVSYMINGYRQGLTPNPDIKCNKEIKFGLFLEKALKLGAVGIATGHYVKLKNNQLFQAVDKNKDQSYFLWTLTADQLKHCLFPLADYTKQQVRALARQWGLLTADKKDSQGICFLGKITLTDFLKQYLPEKEGLVLSAAGQRVGIHNGSHFYTIGQRHGLGLGNLGSAPHYVVEKNAETNTLTIAEDNDCSSQREVKLKDINLIGQIPSAFLVRLRYRQPLFEAKLLGERLIFNQPQKFIAPGQSAVFYSSAGQLLGGGVIV